MNEKNDDMLNDPQLQALESRLAALTPQPSLQEQQRLLYECAFAAGRKAATRATRRWQAAAAVLAILLGVGLPMARESSPLAKRAAPPPAPEVKSARPTPEERHFPQFPQRRVAAVALDAWQTRPSTADSLARELAQFERADARERSLTLGVMTREILNP
jgi:hypothetical protein